MARVSRKKREQKDCFVICPFGDEGSETRYRSDTLMERVISPIASEFDYKAFRSLDTPRPRQITEYVIEQLMSADLVIADLTEANPNVFYELALRHANGLPFVHMIQEGEEIPFDLAQFDVVKIMPSETGLETTKDVLRQHVSAVEDGDASFVSSVSDQFREIRVIDETIIKRNIVRKVTSLFGRMQDFGNKSRKQVKVYYNSTAGFGSIRTIGNNPYDHLVIEIDVSHLQNLPSGLFRFRSPEDARQFTRFLEDYI